MSIRDWFIEPRSAPPPERHGDNDEPPGRPAVPPDWTPPAPERVHAPPREPAPAGLGSQPFRDATQVRVPAGAQHARDERPLSAAVAGRPGEAEPVAAAIALGLRASARAPAASVVVVGADAASPAGGGVATRGARRLAARLAAHGVEASARGRLTWAHVPEAAARRAAAVGAPAVVAVTVPLTPGLEEVIAEQELAIVVAAGADGPLARAAVAALARPGLELRCVAPLPRGIARMLARAGWRAPPHLRLPA